MLTNYLNSIKKRDPSAKSNLSILLTYPGVKALFFHRIGNFFVKLNLISLQESYPSYQDFLQV